MGINEKVPVILSVWFFIILILLSGIGLVKINEKIKINFFIYFILTVFYF